MVRLPKYIAHLTRRLDITDESLASIQEALSLAEEENRRLRGSLDNLANDNKRFAILDDKVSDLQHNIESAKRRLAADTPREIEHAPVNSTVSDNHAFDMFYKKFEDKFRGDEELIQSRVAEHLHLFKELSNELQKKPIIDIGCGRGEFLGVMKSNGFNAIGVDMNKDMVERATRLGYTAHQNDALSYLESQKSSSVSAITGFHIVEHIPFESLMSIFGECYRVISRGGFVLFETPNPASLNVGANTFYTDPSHIRPIPSELLAFMLEYVGFESDIVPLHRQEAELITETPGLHEVHEAIFGNPDYAVIARKK